jgi:DNA gyrase subunit B
MKAPHSDGKTSPLSSREHVRRYPSMYIGSTDSKGLHNALFEVMAHSIDEAMASNCTTIHITLRPNAEVCISDNSEGIPTTWIPDADKSILEICMTETRVGSSTVFNRFHVAGSFYGQGLPIINVLCAHMTAEVRRDGFLWRQSYREGVPQTPLEQVQPLSAGETTGNTFTFVPDFTIFEPNEFDHKTIAERCSEVSYTVMGLTIELRDERSNDINQETFYAPDGIRNLIERLNHDKELLNKIVIERQRLQIERSGHTAYSIIIEVAFQYTTHPETTLLSYVNTTRIEAGTHIDGFKLALTNRVKSMSRVSVEWEDVARGLTAVINVLHPHAAFESNMRFRLINTDVFGHVMGTTATFHLTNDNLFTWLPSKKHSSP